MDQGGRSLGKQIKIASAEKIPVFGVVGKDEAEGGTLSLKSRKGAHAPVETTAKAHQKAHQKPQTKSPRPEWRLEEAPGGPTLHAPRSGQPRPNPPRVPRWPATSCRASPLDTGGELGSLSVDEAVARMAAAQKAYLEPHEVPASAAE